MMVNGWSLAVIIVTIALNRIYEHKNKLVRGFYRNTMYIAWYNVKRAQIVWWPSSEKINQQLVAQKEAGPD
jgi:hypothetical protein